MLRPLCWLVLSVAATASCAREAPSTVAASVTASATTLAPSEALDRLDTRTPVPLLPMMANHQKQNMRDHLVAVQEITSALAIDDFAAIERAARRIGFSEQMGQMCTHMGAGAAGFTEQALNFHHTADTIAAAAQQRDRVAVTRALGATLQTCTSCHATFRQEIVDEATWNRLTSTLAPTPMEHSPH
jgi:Cytochrome C'